MVNKAALGVVGVIVVATLGGSLVLGTLLDPGDERGPGGPTDGETPTPTESESATESSTGTLTEGEGDHTPILPRRFSSEAIEDNVTRLINEARANESRSTLETEGSTSADLRTMARDHSVDMADAGYDAHVVAGTNVSQRYRNHGLYERCQYSDSVNVISPGYQDYFEVVGSGTIGEYDRNSSGNSTFVDDESRAATIVVAEMLADSEVRERLTNQYFERTGVGVEITRENEFFVAVNLCS